ncbi:hypothetical protein BAUCODRAFT_62098 [Baudoinia panamericana UAMH 10762]|uniref:Uncharacterized protein n=1 Tax=Baudoinia panamericana (strain UAMH 10762) TaxID=717646 RepID=M2MUR6_BAUPA|nr:uncharacterized protein BAUCODRAFT_62098 [Baudoinia panamericana UAMH 10762]EMD00682.1 hypothetical protein BAUCODRAFT_62098 [Baudoinia panamericana UAMH 10762]
MERLGTSLLEKVSETPMPFADCCANISLPMLCLLASKLPHCPAVVVSVGSGSGLLETLLIQVTNGNVDLVGVEVPSCRNKYLPCERLLRVPCTESLHPDALLASALMFVYPRKASIVARYLESYRDGAVERLLWLGHKCDIPEMEEILRPYSSSLEIVDGPGLAAYEAVLVASL